METRDNRYHVPAVVRELIAAKIQRLVRRGDVRVQDAEDVGQHLATHYFKRLPGLAEEKAASLAYLSVMLDRCLASLWRDQRAKKRSAGRTYCLPEQAIAIGAGRKMVLYRQACDQRCGQGQNQQEVIELAVDVASVLDLLPSRLRGVAELLMKGSKAQAARDRGVSRSTQDREIRALRRWFERAGLQLY
jgi:hypothetical protein